MTTPTLFLLALAALLWLGHDIWAGIQNTLSRYRSGTGARHRKPGLALPWRRYRAPAFPPRQRLHPQTGPIVIPRWDVGPGSTYFTPVTHADRLQAIDLSALRQLAAAPLVPLAVAA
jgi:hypothetical protein